MRSITNIAMALLLGTAMTACQGSPQNQDTPKVKAKAEAMETSGFDQTLANAKARVAARLGDPLAIPVPKDPGGGYTHETHKANGFLLYDIGQLYELTGDKKYADFAAQAMLDYAKVYPAWELHPAQKEQSPGRMFWQNLNESMFLLNVAQCYDAIKETLTSEQKETIETDLLRNMADFLSVGAPETFNKVHNHGTWATAAVGLTGYAIGDDEICAASFIGIGQVR